MLSSDLSRCLGLQASPQPSVQEVVQALTADYKDLELEIITDDSRIILRHGPQKPDQLLARGLTLNDEIVRVYELVNSSNPNIFEIALKGVCTTYNEAGDKNTKTTLQDALAPYGEVLKFRQEYYPNSKLLTGNASILLDTTGAASKTIPRSFTHKLGDCDRQVTCTPLGKPTTWCFYCRGVGHSRQECTNAPKCKNCKTHLHPTRLCRRAGSRGETGDTTDTTETPPSPEVGATNTEQPLETSLKDLPKVNVNSLPPVYHHPHEQHVVYDQDESPLEPWDDLVCKPKLQVEKTLNARVEHALWSIGFLPEPEPNADDTAMNAHSEAQTLIMQTINLCHSTETAQKTLYDALLTQQTFSTFMTTYILSPAASLADEDCEMGETQ